MRRALVIFAAAVVLLGGTVALADSFSLTFADASGNSNISGTALVSAIPEIGGEYLLTGGTGSLNYNLQGTSYSYTMTVVPLPQGDSAGTIALSPNGGFLYDNLMWPNAPSGLVVDSSAGLLFAIDDGTGVNELNIWGNGAGQFYTAFTGIAAYNYPVQDSVTFSVQPVPDGGMTLMLLGGSLVGLGALRRKFRA